MEGRERSQSKTEPSTASTVSPSQSRESRFSRSFGGVGGAGSATVAGDAWPASKVDSGEAPREEIAVKAEGDRRPSNVASDSRVSVDGSDGNATGGAAGRVADEHDGRGRRVLDLRVSG